MEYTYKSIQRRPLWVKDMTLTNRQAMVVVMQLLLYLLALIGYVPAEYAADLGMLSTK